jgi:hypothetical protein
MPSGGPAQPGAAPTPEETKIREIFDAARAKFPVKGRLNTGELQLLINGRHSALDIKNMLDAQGEAKADLQDVLNHLEQLKAVGLIEM